MDSNRPNTSTKLPLSSESFLYFLSFVEESSLMKEAAWLFKYWRAFWAIFCSFYWKRCVVSVVLQEKTGRASGFVQGCLGKLFKLLSGSEKTSHCWQNWRFLQNVQDRLVKVKWFWCAAAFTFFTTVEKLRWSFGWDGVFNPHRYKINPETINM